MATNDNYMYLAGHLDQALEHLLAIRIAVGLDAKGVPEPPDVLDHALGSDRRAQEARRAVQRALGDLAHANEPKARQTAAYAAEEAINRLVTAALDLGWRFGWTAGSGSRG